MKPSRIAADFSIFAKGYVRNPIALFFSLVFPLILIGLFGLIFNGGTTKVNVETENLDHNSPVSRAFLTALNNSGDVSISVVNVSGNFSQWLATNGYTIGLVIPNGFGSDYSAHRGVNITVYTDPQDPTSSGVLLGAVEGVSNAFNLEAANGSTIVGASTATVGSHVYKYIDYLVPGLIGFSILTSPMFAMVDIASSYRKDNIFRELSLTPLTKAEWLTAKILWYVLITFVTAALMLAMGIYAFGAHVTFTIGMVPFLVLGPFFFVSLGMLAGSVARTPEAAAVIGNIITFPMMFLSGTFFPVSEFSPPLKAFAHILPLYYVIDGMNQVMLFQNYGTDLWTDIGVVLAGSIVVFVAAVLAFKWRDA
jgi:ABC-2 type transport system permease protein